MKGYLKNMETPKFIKRYVFETVFPHRTTEIIKFNGTSVDTKENACIVYSGQEVVGVVPLRNLSHMRVEEC